MCGRCRPRRERRKWRCRCPGAGAPGRGRGCAGNGRCAGSRGRPAADVRRPRRRRRSGGRAEWRRGGRPSRWRDRRRCSWIDRVGAAGVRRCTGRHWEGAAPWARCHRRGGAAARPGRRSSRAGAAAEELRAKSIPAPDGGETVITPPHTEHRARTPASGILAGSTRKTELHSGQVTFTTDLRPERPAAIRRFASRRRAGYPCGGRSSRPILGASLRSSSSRLRVR